jgi:hypothetical protein
VNNRPAARLNPIGVSQTNQPSGAAGRTVGVDLSVGRRPSALLAAEPPLSRPPLSLHARGPPRRAADPRRPPQAKGTVRTRPLPSSSPAPSPPVTPTFASSLFLVLPIYIHSHTSARSTDLGAALRAPGQCDLQADSCSSAASWRAHDACTCLRCFHAPQQPRACPRRSLPPCRHGSSVSQWYG